LSPEASVSRDTGPFAEVSYLGSAAIARAYTNLLDFDVAAQAGKIYGGYQLGAGFAGSLGDYGIRGEAAYVVPQDTPPLTLADSSGTQRSVTLVKRHASVVAGVDWRMESGLYLSSEYLYNGSGESRDYAAAALRVAAGEMQSLGKHLLGLLADYPLTSVHGAKLASLVSLTDGSVLLVPTLTYSVANNVHFELGALVAPIVHSEYASYPNVVFFDLSLYL
jgi:hypothetical protein